MEKSSQNFLLLLLLLLFLTKAYAVASDPVPWGGVKLKQSRVGRGRRLREKGPGVASKPAYPQSLLPPPPALGSGTGGVSWISALLRALLS